jgi:sugar lactone lactonase YvrE
MPQTNSLARAHRRTNTLLNSRARTLVVGLLLTSVTLPVFAQGTAAPSKPETPVNPAAQPADVTPARKPIREFDPQDGLAQIFRAAEPIVIVEGLKFCEGPTWDAARDGGKLVFTDIPGDRVYALKPDPEKPIKISEDHAIARGGNPNGTTLDRDGRLIVCRHAGAIGMINAKGEWTVLADNLDGKRLNSPNDVAVRSDGSIFFTDPTFGVRKADRKLEFAGVFRLPADASKNGKPVQPILLDKDIQLPNGIVLSPDEKTLYVADSRTNNVYAYDVAADGSVSNKREFGSVRDEAAGGAADGVRVDTVGNVYVAGSGGVWVFMSTGQKIGRLKTPGNPSNLAFGGEDGRTLFITSGNKVLMVPTVIKGVMPGPADAPAIKAQP